MSDMNKRDALLARWKGPVLDRVEIQGIEGVYIRALTNLQVQQWAAALTHDEKGTVTDLYAQAKLIQISLVDSDNQPIFSEPNDYMRIVESLNKNVKGIIRRIEALSGIGLEADAETLKNSEPAGAVSSSG